MAPAAPGRFHERVRNPSHGRVPSIGMVLQVSDVYPKSIPDLFSAKPVILRAATQPVAKGPFA